jgi:cyclophilin family peptidyl-prolyl cis-trans isomerase
VTFTAGQMEAVVPEGYGIPVASEENWRFVCQALNQNLEGTHTFRHRITVYFSRDRELKAPLQPLTWTIAWVTVPLDGGEEPSAVCPCCGKLRNGIDAAAAINRYRMQDGRNAVGHWMLPVGTSTWHSAVRELTRGLDRDRELVGTWVHVHPFAERMTLRAYDANCESPRDLWSSRVRNATTGVGLEEVETLSTPKGISMPAAWNYEVEISYNNTSGAKQDAMAMMGLFVTAPEWDAPAWTRSPQRTTLFPEFDPGIASNPASKAGGNTAGSASSNALYTKLPLFRGAAASSDKPYRVEMETSEGVVHFRVMPSWAPKTAAALKQILGHNLYAGLELRPVGDGFALQVPEVRPSGLASEDDRALLCRLPAEPNSKVPHRAGRLTMSMWADQENSVTSSFSFITRDAPHLDGKYTVFAELSDGTTRESLEELAKRAAKGQGIRIVKTSVLE